jgi:hypothetical protein
MTEVTWIIYLFAAAKNTQLFVVPFPLAKTATRFLSRFFGVS